MITLGEFQNASFEKKCDWVTGNSNFIMARKLGDTKVYLYHGNDFFIEVYYSPVYRKILMINAFNNLAGLEPYAADVSLSDLKL